MNNDAPVISAVGMTTPVGLSALQSCAAVRAGISAMEELNFTVEDDTFDKVPVAGCAVRGLTDGYHGLGRWTRLAATALKDLVTTSRLTREALSRTGLYLALPPLDRAGVDKRIGQLLAARIAQWLGARGLDDRTSVYPYGHAAGALACQEALAHVSGGVVDRAIVCGVDSLVEVETLKFFVTQRRLKTADNVDGFVPGEAAACVLLESPQDATSRGAKPLAWLEAPATAVESVTIWHDQPGSARGLSDAIAATLAHATDQGRRTAVVVSDLNGETYRAKEFGLAAARRLAAIPTPWVLWHPADCIGDTGGAAFVVAVVVGARALVRGYARGDQVLILGSSDDGLRGAASLRRLGPEA